jgi:hypothetical protein
LPASRLASSRLPIPRGILYWTVLLD